MLYKQYKNFRGSLVGIIRFNDDNSHTSFPIDPANIDYQEYLKWLEEGNEPLPADEPAE